MDQHHNDTISSEITFQHHTDDVAFKKKVKRATIILSVITVVELSIGLLIYNIHKGANPSEFLVLFFKGLVCILTLAKAYYIISVFMHLGDEIRNFMMTVILPLILFIWFIIAFLADGNSYRNLRNRYDKHFHETTVPAKHITPAIKEPGGRQ